MIGTHAAETPAIGFGGRSMGMAPQQGNPWDNDEIVAPAPSVSARPGVILGPPTPPDLIELERLELARRTAGRADARAVQSAERDDRAALRDEMRLRNDGRLHEFEGKTTNFYNAARGSEQEWRGLEANPELREGTQPAGVLGDAARAILPAGVVNSFTSEARQRAQQAKENFIRASLRLESGAAIGEGEYDRQNRIFYPQTGDDEGTIAQKARARQQIIEGFRIGSGRGAEKVDQLRRADGELTMNADIARPEERSDAVNLTEAQRAQFQALAQNGATPDQLEAYARSLGLTVPREQREKGAAFYANPANRDTPPEIRVDNSIKPVDPGDGALGAAARGAFDTASMGFIDEAAALSDSISFGTTYESALDRQRGMAKFDEEKNGSARFAGQLAGGLVLPGFGAKSAKQLAMLGAGYGAAYGAGSADGGGGDRLLGSYGGAASGWAAGGALGAVGNRIAAGIGSKAAARAAQPTMGVQVADAAARQGVPITVPHIAPASRGVYGAVESVPLAGSPVGKALTRTNENIARRVGEVGGTDIVDQQTLGGTIRKAGERYIERSGQVGNRAYGVAERRAAGQQITPTQAVAEIDRQISELSRAPETNSEVLGLLNRYRADMVDAAGAPKALDLDVIRGMRTGLRGKTNTEGLRGTDAERRAGRAMDGADRDIRSQLSSGALSAYDRADRIWKGRSEHIDRVVEAFIGGRGGASLSPEQTANNVTIMAGPRRGDAGTLQKMMATLAEPERRQVTSTIASQLGRRGENGDAEFSAQRFFGAVQKYSPAARKAIWGDQGAKDLADLAKVAEQQGFVAGRLNNSSSGRAVNFYKTLTGILGGGAGVGAAIGGVYGSAPGVVGAVAASYVTAKVLSSPKIVGVLAYAARSDTLAKQSTAIRRMAALAAREPELSQDLLPIKEKLEEAWAEDHRTKRDD